MAAETQRNGTIAVEVLGDYFRMTGREGQGDR
jgi:hypothetical protein